jgi:hypothetical protein
VVPTPLSIRYSVPYLFISLDRVVLFLDAVKLTDEVKDHLGALNIERKEYNDIWALLRRRDWGEGKVLISPETSCANTFLSLRVLRGIVFSHPHSCSHQRE